MSSDQSPEPRWFYDAFLSYSHAADHRLAPAVQRCLHRLAKRWYQPRALRVFRDKGSLVANPDLWVTLENALRDSRYFILLASPEAARSEWVRREVSFWQANRERDALLIALTEGEIHWDADAGDFDWRRTTALPEQLRGWFHAQPLWVDLTWARTETQLSERHVRFRDNMGALAASLHGIPREELDSEDIRQHRLATRLRWAAITGLLTLLVIALLTASVAVQLRRVAEQQRLVAEQQRQLAEEQRRLATGRALLAEAENLRETQPRTSLQLNLAALRVNSTPQARIGLISNLMRTRFAGSASSADSGGIAVAVFSPDARMLATVDDFSGEPESVMLWEVNDTELTSLAFLSEHTGAIQDVAFSADGRTLATAAADNTVILWDLTKRTEPRRVATLTNVSPVEAVAFSPDGTTLATVGSGEDTGGSLILWHIGDRSRPRRLVTQTKVHDSSEVLFSPNGRLLLTSKAPRIPTQSPTNPGMHPDSGQTLWDVTERTRPRVLKRLPRSEEVQAFSQDSRLLATADARNAVLWDISAPGYPKRLATLPGHTDTLRAVEFSPDGRALATTSYDGTALLWDLSEPTRPSSVRLTGRTDLIGAVAFSPDGLTVNTADRGLSVTRWHTRPTQPTAVATLTDPAGVGKVAAFSPDDRILATAGFRGTVLLWDATDPSHLVRSATLPGHAAAVNDVAFHADGTTLASATGDPFNDSGKGTIVLWDVTAREHPRPATTLSRSTAVTSVAFSPLGTTLVALGGLPADDVGGRPLDDTWATLWDVKDRLSPRLLNTFSDTGGILGGFAIRPDGQVLALTQDFTMVLWDISTPTRPVRLSSESDMRSAWRAAFSPDGRSLGTIHPQAPAKLWDITDPARPRHLAELMPGHTGELNDIGYHPGGNLLATVSEDGTAILWDVADRTAPNRVATLRMGSSDVLDLAFSSNGRWLVTSSNDTLAVVWDLGVLPTVVADAVGVACQLVGPGLSPEEWKQYVPGLPYQPLCP